MLRSHATDLFAERGPAATSIRDIAARSGVNDGLVFRPFGTKKNNWWVLCYITWV